MMRKTYHENNNEKKVDVPILISEIWTLKQRLLLETFYNDEKVLFTRKTK